MHSLPSHISSYFLYLFSPQPLSPFSLPHHHETVEDRKPVNAMLEEIWVEILVKPVLKLSLRLFPDNLE